MTTCRICGRESRPEPTRGLEAGVHRINIRAAIPERGDMLAYAFCKSTVLITSEARDKFCDCDRRNWNQAIEEYRARGAEACWAALDVNDEVMRQAREQCEREQEALDHSDDEDDETQSCDACGTTIDNPTGELPPDDWYALHVEKGEGPGVASEDTAIVCSIECAKKYLDTWEEPPEDTKPS